MTQGGDRFTSLTLSFLQEGTPYSKAVCEDLNHSWGGGGGGKITLFQWSNFSVGGQYIYAHTPSAALEYKPTAKHRY